MITNFFIPELNNHDVQELWFQQDGATCHTARASIDLLKDTFALDYFLWGYVKSLVYADKPQTLDPLEDNIRPVIADIRPQMLEKVIENWTPRLDYIRASCGSPMPEILFKIKEGDKNHQTSSSRVPFYSAKRIIKGYRKLVWSKFNQKNKQKVWLSKLLDIPKWSRDRAVVNFRIVTGHDCLSKHLNTIGIAQSPV
ncbi:hypothetical protein TNCV_4456891 [Trichonephila clavipes]|nr:hypothetical protein TNCV_4456891 [Trichonephila clavipes]